jgi:hypothetical protein
MTSALDQVYSGWDRFRHRIDSIFGKDSVLDELSDKLNEVKKNAYKDGRYEPHEFEEVQRQTNLVLDAYQEVLRQRGFDTSRIRPTNQDSFRYFAELQQIHFSSLAGKHLDSGSVDRLTGYAAAGDARKLKEQAKQVAFDLVNSHSRELASDGVRLLRTSLSRIPDRHQQTTAMMEVRRALAELIGGWRATQLPKIDLDLFDQAVSFQTTVATYRTPLPESVRGNQMFPNKPLGQAWEDSTRLAVKQGLDDMARKGLLFIDRIPNDGQVKKVALKLDLNLGADGPPSVSDPATTKGTILELLERAEKKGRRITLTVGDSAGGENIPIGRTTMDIMRDTGNYHMALKAGLLFAEKKGSAEATECLRFIAAAEARGVYFGSKDDKETGKAIRERVEAACAEYVRPVDYDREGYTSVNPELGPMGLAAWGTREFQIAKPWVEADYRVHVSRALSNHMLAKWTGSLKGLIGLHAFGLRPVDQSMEKRGDSALDFFRFLGAGSVFTIFEKRSGFTDIAAKILASGDLDLQRAHELVEAKWKNLQGNVEAWKIFQRETRALTEELDRDKAGGASEVEIADKMRWRTREILERAEQQGNAPGFMQSLWDTVHDASRVAMRLGWTIRGVLPSDARDEQVGQRIGLLTALPYQSDLVVQCQPKIGLEGGPDAYRKVIDTGFISVGTNEAALDAVAWQRAGLKDHMWTDNWPLYHAQQYGRAPMHLDEVTRLGDR